MQKMPDPRWNTKLMLPTLLFQLAAVVCLVGLSGSLLYHSFLVSIGPLAAAALGVVSALTQLICWATGALHPLVVLTLACEWMVLWLAATTWVVLVYTQDAATVCDSDAFGDYYYYRGDNPRLREALAAYRKMVCRKNAAIVALMVLTTISYIWLVAYSAVVRKRTRMPFVPRSADC